MKKFVEKQACYQVFYESRDKPNNRYTNWQTNIAPTKPEVEDYLTKKGYDWKWGEDDSLLYWQNFPPVVDHPLTGEKCWYNQIHAHHKTFYTNHPSFVKNPVVDGRWPVHCTYGDGTELEPEVLNHLRQTVWANTVVIAPQAGDVFIVDNYLTLHGRMASPKGLSARSSLSLRSASCVATGDSRPCAEGMLAGTCAVHVPSQEFLNRARTRLPKKAGRPSRMIVWDEPQLNTSGLSPCSSAAGLRIY